MSLTWQPTDREQERVNVPGLICALAVSLMFWAAVIGTVVHFWGRW